MIARRPSLLITVFRCRRYEHQSFGWMTARYDELVIELDVVDKLFRRSPRVLSFFGRCSDQRYASAGAKCLLIIFGSSMYRRWSLEIRDSKTIWITHLSQPLSRVSRRRRKRGSLSSGWQNRVTAKCRWLQAQPAAYQTMLNSSKLGCTSASTKPTLPWRSGRMATVRVRTVRGLKMVEFWLVMVLEDGENYQQALNGDR